jgi:phage portal protein BeeE
MNDNRVTVKEATDKNILTGESKMKGLTAAINNLRYAYESRGIILKNRGALGILSNSSTDVAGAVPLDPEEKRRVQEEYRNYGSLATQNQVIITNANLKWQKMGVNPSELGLFEETEQDFFKICDTYGTPIDLFASTKGSTFENQRQAEKGLYLRTIIPEANEWIASIAQGMELEGVKLVMDFSHLPIFQEDMKARGESLTAITNALSKMFVDGAISIEEYKEELKKYGIGKA